MKNTGKPLETELARIFAEYGRRGLLSLEKVDPPTRVIYKFGKPVTIQLENPFLDFLGTWSERAGRSVFLEAKSTEKENLTLNNSGGISEKQMAALERWATAGAAVGVLWGYKNEIRFVPLAAIRAQLNDGVKHVKWGNASRIPRGMGWVTWDVLQTLRAYYPAPAKRAD